PAATCSLSLPAALPILLAVDVDEHLAQRRLLDDYAGASELARQVQLAAQRCRQTEQALEQASNISEEQNARQQLLSYQLEELDRSEEHTSELQSRETLE